MSEPSTEPAKFRKKRESPVPEASALVVSTVAARKMLHIGKTKMADLVRYNIVDSTKIGRSRRITVDSIRRLIEQGAPGRQP